MLLSIMGTPNAVVIAVIVMLALSLSRIHVVLSLAIGAFVGGLVAGMPLENVTDMSGEVTQTGIISAFNEGLKGGAQIALSPPKSRTKLSNRGKSGQMAVVVHHLGHGCHEPKRRPHPYRLYPDDCAAVAAGI